MQISSKITGLLFVLASAASFSTGAIIIKLAYKIQLSWWEFTTLQMMFSSGMLLITYGVLRWRKQEKSVPPSTLFNLAILGIFGTLPAIVCYNLALVYLDASIAIVLFYTYPIFTALGATVIFHERIRGRHYICLILTVLGTIFTIELWKADLGSVSMIGILFITLCSISYSFFTLYGQKNMLACSSMAITTFTQTFALLVFSVVKPPVFLLHGVSTQALIITFVMAFFNSALGNWLMLKGVGMIGASKSALITTSEIPMTILLAMLILAEQPTIYQAIGATFIICSIIFLDIEDNSNRL